MKPLPSFAVGVWAALVTPLYLRGDRLAKLRAPVSPGNASASDNPGAERAVRIALGLIRRLGVLRLPAWRNTCLYRSVAECLALRAHGVGARVMLGVRNANPPHGPIEAHAWVSVGDAAQPDGYSPLESADARAMNYVC